MQVGGCSGAGAGQAAPMLAAVKLQHAQSAHLDSEHQASWGSRGSGGSGGIAGGSLRRMRGGTVVSRG
jgi:hypothetical protein